MSGLVNPFLFGVGALTLASLMSGGPLSPRPRSRWLQVFDTWAGPPSTVQEERIARTERMVREALEQFPDLSDYSLSVLGHGSSINNTNVKLTSDLDLIVMHNGGWVRPAPGESLPPGYGGGTAVFVDEHSRFRQLVHSALENTFGFFAVEPRTKCINLTANPATRVSCDVLPCFRIAQFLPRSEWFGAQPRKNDGIIFATSNGQQIVSFPEQHLQNGRQKNKATGYRYKQVVRVIKTFRQEFQQGMTLLSAGPLPSPYQLECLIYNVPDAVLLEGDLYSAVERTLTWLSWAIANQNECESLRKVNGIERLYAPWAGMGTGLLGGPSAPPTEANTANGFVDRVITTISKQS